MYCNHCGAPLEEGKAFCPNCGTQVNAQANQQAAANDQNAQANQYNAAGVNPNFNGYNPGFDPNLNQNVQRPSGVLDTGMLVWSIINTFCCFPILGIIAWVFVFQARDAYSLEEEQRKLKTVKTLNLIATIVGVVCIVLVLIYMIVVASTIGGIFGTFDQLYDQLYY